MFRETAILFARKWRQVDKKKDKLVTMTTKASSNSVQDDIAQYVNNLDENLIDLESTLKLSKDPDLKMDMESAKLYIEKLSRSADYIEKIEDAVQAINVQLSSRIKSFKYSLVESKKKIEGLTKPN